MTYAIYLSYIALAVVLWLSATIVYQLYLHPLTSFPGPKIAAISRIYEWYFDCFQSGRYWSETQRLHDKYGPIVRVGPNEVHINDPEWFNALYNTNIKVDKDPWFYNLSGNHDAAFSTVEHDVHRIKRSKQNPFFSRQNVDKASYVVTGILSSMLDHFEMYRGTGKPLNIRYASKSYAADVACEYCFIRGMGFVKSQDFSRTFHLGRDRFAVLFPWMRQFPSFARFAATSPDWMTKYMDKETQAAVSFIKFCELQVKESIQQSTEKVKTANNTIIRSLYESDMPEQYRTTWVLGQEAVALVAAGIATVSHSIEKGIFYILNDPAIAARLTKEVRECKPEEKGLLTQRDLENLPFLSAVVLEIQRIIPAIRSRLPRINRQQDMRYGNYVIPKGTTISMSLGDILLNDKIWGNAHEFDPSRWLDAEYKAKMQKYMVGFSRGPRACVGQNLAIAEVYTVLGNFFRRFDAKLFDTGIREIEVVHDYFDSQPASDTVGVRLLLN